jgi:hypothetical protein
MKYPGALLEQTGPLLLGLPDDVTTLDPTPAENAEFIAKNYPAKLVRYANALSIGKGKDNKLCVFQNGMECVTTTFLLKALNGDLTEESIKQFQSNPGRIFIDEDDTMRLLAFAAKYLPVWSQRRGKDIMLNPGQISRIPGWATFASIWPQLIQAVQLTPNESVEKESYHLMCAVEGHAFTANCPVTGREWEAAIAHLLGSIDTAMPAAGTAMPVAPEPSLSITAYNALALLITVCKQKKLLGDVTLIIRESNKQCARDGKARNGDGDNVVYLPTINIDVLMAGGAPRGGIGMGNPAFDFQVFTKQRTEMAKFFPKTNEPITIKRLTMVPPVMKTPEALDSWKQSIDMLQLPKSAAEMPLVAYLKERYPAIGEEVLKILQVKEPAIAAPSSAYFTFFPLAPGAQVPQARLTIVNMLLSKLERLALPLKPADERDIFGRLQTIPCAALFLLEQRMKTPQLPILMAVLKMLISNTLKPLGDQDRAMVEGVLRKCEERSEVSTASSCKAAP